LPGETKSARRRTMWNSGRLHSMQGLAQSNNNARLNYSAKHVIKAAGNKVQKLSKGMGERKNTKVKNKEQQGRTPRRPA